MTSGGFVGGGESSSAKKVHLRNIRSGETLEVQTVSKLPRLDTTITFLDFDMKGSQHPHDDPFVIKAIVANKTIHRVLVDNGSSADIIFTSAFDKMGIGMEKLGLINTCLRGFSGERVLPLRSIQLVLTLGDPPCQATTTVRFLIVDTLSAYNMLMGRPPLNAIRAILRLSHGYQISNYKWSRNGLRKSTHSQGMLLSFNEAKHGRQHLYGRTRLARQVKHPSCALRRTRACTA